VPRGGQSVRNVIDGTLAVPATFRHNYIAEKAVALMDGKGILAERSEAVGGDVGAETIQEYLGQIAPTCGKYFCMKTVTKLVKRSDTQKFPPRLFDRTISPAEQGDVPMEGARRPLSRILIREQRSLIRGPIQFAGVLLPNIAKVTSWRHHWAKPCQARSSGAKPEPTSTLPPAHTRIRLHPTRRLSTLCWSTFSKLF
jgi:hypothetical protein